MTHHTYTNLSLTVVIGPEDDTTYITRKFSPQQIYNHHIPNILLETALIINILELTPQKLNNRRIIMGMSIPHLILLLIVVLVLFGAGRLPKVMGDIGKGVRNFRDGLSKQDKEDEDK